MPLSPPPPSASLRASLVELAQAALRSESGRRLAYFGCALAAFAAVQAAYALSVGSLGLLSDAMLRLLHVSGLAISLLADASGGAGGAAAAGASFAFSYGLAPRLEVLAAFSQVRCEDGGERAAPRGEARCAPICAALPALPLPRQALFSLFLAMLIAAHALLRLLAEPAPFEAVELLALEFGVVGLALSAAGTAVLGPSASMLGYVQRFQRQLAAGAGGAAKAPAEAAAPRLPAYLLADALSSLAVIAAALLLRFHDAAAADALQCLASSALTLYIVAPLFSATAAMLLQRVPVGLAGALARARREVSVIDGVLEVFDEHYWQQAPACVVGSLCLRLRPGAPAAAIRAQTTRVFGALVQDLTVQTEFAVAFDG